MVKLKAGRFNAAIHSINQLCLYATDIFISLGAFSLFSMFSV